MRLKTVRPRQGLQWVREGFRAFAGQPLAYTALLGLAGFLMLLLAVLPGIGPVLALGLLPLLSWGFTAAGEAQAQGRRIPPLPFLPALREPRLRRGFLLLGGLYAASALLAGSLADVLDGGRFNAIVAALGERQADGGDPGQGLDTAGLDASVALRLLLLGSLSLAFWHAPALMVRGGQTVAQSLFGSVLACWRGLGAYLLMGLAWFVLLLLVLSLAQLLMIALGLVQAAGLMAVPAAMAFSTAFYASLWRVYTDTFEEAPAA